MTQQLTQIEDSVLNETILQSAQTQSSAEAEAAAEAAAKEEEEVMRAIRLNEEEEEIRLLIINSKKAQEEEDANISEAKMIEMRARVEAEAEVAMMTTFRWLCMQTCFKNKCEGEKT